MIKRSFYVLFFLFLFCFTVYAEYIDIVYLKDGSIIKGVIIEQIPGKSIKIETKGGSIFVYRYSDILKIAKEKDTTEEVSQPPDIPQKYMKELTEKGITSGVIPKIGVNVSTVSVSPAQSYPPDPLAGFVGGLGFEFGSGMFGCEIDIFFSQKGYTSSSSGAAYMLNYLCIPIIPKLVLSTGEINVFFGAGVEIGVFLFGLIISEDGYVEDIESDGIESVDLGLPISIGLELSGFVIDARYTFGLLNIIPEEWGGSLISVKNSTVSLMIGYKIKF